MAIKLPIEVLRLEGAVFYYLKDASGRTIAGGLYKEDAEEIVNALNALSKGGFTFMDSPQPRRKSKKVQVEEALRRSDLSAQLSERDNIEYGPHDCLPRGEHVARMKNGRS